jgi:hypothetical protein
MAGDADGTEYPSGGVFVEIVPAMYRTSEARSGMSSSFDEMAAHLAAV